MMIWNASSSSASPRFQAMLDRSRRSIKEGGGLSEEDFLKAVRKRAAGAKGSGRGKPRDQRLRAEPSGRPPMISKQPVE